MDIQKVVEALTQFPAIEGIALGGSRASGRFDEKSDYDLYVYFEGEIDDEKRREVLSEFCSEMEIGNHYWEEEDNCKLKDGTGLDIIFRTFAYMDRYFDWVIDGCHPFTGYTTCIWDNIVTCKVLYDKQGKMKDFKEKFSIEYPEKLQKAIIKTNMNLLTGTLPSYDKQLKKCFQRGDRVSINHRSAEFLASYFDIVFAMNKKLHTGEKREISICKNECKILPNNFEENIDKFFDNLFTEKAYDIAEDIIQELQKTLKENNFNY